MKKAKGTGFRSKTRYNFILGNNSQHWVNGAEAFTEMYINELYPGVDMHLYSHGNALKYDLICANTKSAEEVILQYIGADVTLLSSNKLLIKAGEFQFTDNIPAINAMINGNEVPLGGNFILENNQIRFKIINNSKLEFQKIIIDPELVFSTFSGSTGSNFGECAASDLHGNAYAAGVVFETGLPLSTGAFQTTFKGGGSEGEGFGGGRDLAVFKFSTDGKDLLYCTYIGGTGNEQPHSIITDSNGALYIMGSTNSKNFPVTSGCYDATWNGDYDFFVLALNPDGSSLLASTFIGGTGRDAVSTNTKAKSIDEFPLLYNYGDEFRGEIIIHDHTIYIAGATFNPDFPAYSKGKDGNLDACVFALDTDLKKLLWSRVFGGQGDDAFYGLINGKNEDLFICGGTTTQYFQSSFTYWKNDYQGGMADAMLLHINSKDGSVISGRYYGSNAYEQGYFMQLDITGHPVICGQTEGNFKPDAKRINYSGSGQFITSFSYNLDSVFNSTVFGSAKLIPDISITAFMVDKCGKFYISGWGGRANLNLTDHFSKKLKLHRNTGNTRELSVTPDAVQNVTDGSDFYFAVFSSDLNKMEYASFFGGAGLNEGDADEHIDGGMSRFDKNGFIYQAVCADCGGGSLFPSTPGSYSDKNTSRNCNMALIKLDCRPRNSPPKMKDYVVNALAGDKLDLSLQALDSNETDSVKLKVMEGLQDFLRVGPPPRITFNEGLQKSSLRFEWDIPCSNIPKDTVRYKFLLHDNFCISPDTAWANLKIVVRKPKAAAPPEIECVAVARNADTVRIRWAALNKIPSNLSYYLLKRAIQGNNDTVLAQISDFSAGEYTDLTARKTTENNYCYWLETYNVCNEKLLAGNHSCLRQAKNNIAPVQVKFVTVENDKRVRVEWENSRNKNFSGFEIYRYRAGFKPSVYPHAILRDTFFLDSALDVDSESFCYTVVAKDKCNHYSSLSNAACNIVLSGITVAETESPFSIHWKGYTGWSDVGSYTIEKRNCDNNWSVTATENNLQRSFQDYNSNEYCGGYWYRVTAAEKTNTQKRPAFQSQSNWVFLYRLPQLWVPDAFTPNANGTNDEWGIVPYFVRNYSMTVFNGWGQKVWETQNKNEQWDGIINGKTAETGVYVWSAVFDGWDNKTYTLKGTVTIIH